jgi:hypothetical protein
MLISPPHRLADIEWNNSKRYWKPTGSVRGFGKVPEVPTPRPTVGWTPYPVAPGSGPATTAIVWGAWGQIGRATALAEGIGVAVAPDEDAYAFQAVLRHDRAYTGYRHSWERRA